MCSPCGVWAGRASTGFYEAADYTGVRPDEGPKLVKSYMAHHQGMALAALANALAGDAISRRFESIPEARALSLLLEEKPSARVRLRRRREQLSPENARRSEERGCRLGRVENRLVDAHLLSGAGATALLTAQGCALLTRGGVLANRFFGDLLDRRGDIRLTARDPRGGEEISLCAGQARFDAGWAQYENNLGGVEARLTVALSPEDGTLFQKLYLKNNGTAAREIEITQSFPVALCGRDDCWAHPAFQNMFVASERPGQGALLFTRRPGGPGQCPYALISMVSGVGAPEWETDLARFEGREGHAARTLSGTLGCTLNPCSALRARVRLEAGEKREMHFAVALIPPEEARTLARAQRLGRRAGARPPPRRHAGAGHAGLCRPQHGGVSPARPCRRLFAGRAPGQTRPRGGRRTLCGGRGELWALGVSGDHPLITVAVADRAQLCVARDAVRAHDLYRTLGLACDLVLINDYGNDYEQPVRDAIKDMIAASHLREMCGVPGGVHVLDGAQISKSQRETLRCASAICLEGGAGFFAQLRAKLGALEFGGRAGYREMEARSFKLPPVKRELFNGYGGFAEEGYVIDAAEPTPAAWSNVLAGERFGALITERGGGFLFGKNSRLERLTPFGNDPLREGWGLMLYLADERRGAYARLLPGEEPFTPFRTTHAFSHTRFESGADGVRFSTALYARPDANAIGVEIRVQNTSGKPCEYAVTAFVDWLMGVDARDAAFLRAWNEEGVCLARGATADTGFLTALNATAEAGAERAAFLGHGGVFKPDGLFERRGGRGGWALKARLSLRPGEEKTLALAVGRAESREEALQAIQNMRKQPCALEAAEADWQTRLAALRVQTGDAALDRVFPMLVKQALDGRVRARAGLYQAGGAYGFRDQLQDMLALMHYEPARAREHILRAAARQFAAGDVMHWWHMPYMGVRTHISDDRLFLPYVAAAYVRLTGDAGILMERVPYLRNVDIPEGAEDWYGAGEVSEETGTIHDHCMRAFRLSASLTGEHGLALMGSGDWNDSMNRVGARGRGKAYGFRNSFLWRRSAMPKWPRTKTTAPGSTPFPRR